MPGWCPASSPEPLCSVPDDYRCGKALGPVESLQGHLQDPTRILIGYSRGLLVIWNQAAQCADRVFLGNQVHGGGQHGSRGPLLLPLLTLTPSALQQLESLCWERSGRTLVSSHSDGSYAVWSVDAGDSPMTQPTVTTTPYGECRRVRGQPLPPEHEADWSSQAQALGAAWPWWGCPGGLVEGGSATGSSKVRLLGVHGGSVGLPLGDSGSSCEVGSDGGRIGTGKP